MGPFGGLSPGGSIALGIIVGVLSTSVQSLGLTLQRKSHILEDEKAPHIARRPPHRRRRWQLGMALFLLANLLGSSIQISTLPLPVLSTLQASGLVFNSICATLILSEPFTRWSLWGTLLVCSGAVLIAIFGAIPAPAHNLEELLALLVHPAFIAWMSLQAIVVTAIAVSVELTSAIFFASLAQTPRFRLARGLAYGCISGILSAHSLLVAKSAVELIVRTIADGKNQFRHWQAWALVLTFVVLALAQLYYLHRGLKLVSTSVLYPLVFCVYNIIAILDGLIYFRQTDQIGPLRACLISLGTVVLLSGVLALSWRLSDEQHPPAVGQSSLTPGLGLVEDSAGEDDTDEEVALLIGSDVTLTDVVDEEREIGTGAGSGAVPTEQQRLLPKKRYISSYQTFGLNGNNRAASESALSPAAPGSDSFRDAGPGTTTPGHRTRFALPPLFPQGAQPAMVSSPNASPVALRWTERAEIWDELEDQDDDNRQRRPQSFEVQSTVKRNRSSTLPLLDGSGYAAAAPNTTPPPSSSSQHAPLSPFSVARRGISNGSPSLLGSGHARAGTRTGASASSPRGAEDADADAEALAGFRSSFRKRRRTTGFPGFHARRTDRRSLSGSFHGGGESIDSGSSARSGGKSGQTGLQDALGQIWRRGWWNGTSNASNDRDAALDGATDEAAASPIRQRQLPPQPSTPPARPGNGRPGAASNLRDNAPDGGRSD